MSSIDLGTARGKIEIDGSGAVRAYKDASAEHDGFMGKLDKSSAAIGKTGKAMTGVGVAALGGLGLAVKTAGDFQSSMNRVGAVSGATGGDFDKLSDKAKELGSSTQFSASQAAEGMSFLAMAGFETDEIMSAMPGTLQLAAAGQIELAQAADIASNVLTGYGKTAEDIGQVNDVMAKAASSANTDIVGLGEGMKFVAPVANASGLAFEETTAILGKLADAGIQGGMAGTTLRQSIAALENQTPKATAALEDLGVTTHDAQGDLLPFADIVEQLEDAGLGTADAMKIFGTRAGPGMMALVGQGADSLRDLTGELENSGGAAGEMADRQMEGLNGAMTELKSAVEGAMIAIGEQLLPVLERFADFVSGLIQRFANLSPSMQKIIAVGGALFGALSIVVGVFLIILSKVPAMVKGFQALRIAFTTVLGPVGLVIIAIAAIAAGLVWLFNNNETFRAAVLSAWEQIKVAFQVASVFIQEIFAKIRGFVMAFVQGWQEGTNLFNQTSDGWIAKFVRIGEFLRAIFETIKIVVKSAIDSIKAWWDANGANLLQAAQNIWNAIWTVIKVVIGIIVGIIKVAVNLIMAFWDRFGSTIITFTKNTFNNIKKVIQGVIKVITGIVEFFIALFTGNWSGMADALKKIWSGLWDIIHGVVAQVVNIIAAIISTVVNTIIGLWNTVRDKSIAAWEFLKNKIIEKAEELKTFVKELPGKIIDAFKTLPGKMLRMGKDIVEGLIDGIKNMAGKAIQAAKDLASDVGNQVKDFFTIGSPSKLMMEYGNNIGEGLGIGIEKMAKSVAQSAKAMSGAVTGNVPSSDVIAAHAGSRGASGGAASPLPSAGSRFITNSSKVDMTVINPDNADLMRATQRALRTAASQWEVN